MLSVTVSPIGVGLVSKSQTPSSKIPASPTVKLDKGMFEDLWWTARVEGKSPGEILKEVAGVAVAARRKRHEATITKLVRIDAEEDQIVSRAKAVEG